MARNVVISGGGTGIGLAAARVFAADGDRVLLLGRRAEVLGKAGVPGALTYAADLGDPAAVRGVADFVAREFGTVDVLVNSAGGTGQLEPGSGSDDPLDRVAHDWTVAFRINTLTAALLTEALKDRLASPLGPRGVTANVVAPGYIEDTEFFGPRIDPARRERLVADTSDKRAGTPGDVAATLHWLASPGASHITSQVVQVNGGAERGR
jgi:3-oxoacyl-[acyl-carrier protein] reductase